jgi:hypothetical protein
MNMSENSKVPFTIDNFKKCMCPKCPVQTISKCSKDKLDNFANGLENARKEDVLEPQNVPGVYCSTGKATCQDLNPKKQCICTACEVWKEYHLQKVDPVLYFCTKGKAA